MLMYMFAPSKSFCLDIIVVFCLVFVFVFVFIFVFCFLFFLFFCFFVWCLLCFVGLIFFFFLFSWCNVLGFVVWGGLSCVGIWIYFNIKRRSV